MATAKKSWLQLLGPGLLFAGAAVGVSHLVYSTRAGANYGFGLVWLVLLANLFKYPFFEFGPRYASATGHSLLEGYQKLGKWVLALFGLITIGTMFTVQAAVTLVTASLAVNIFGITDSLLIWVCILLLICSGLLVVGRYKLLDNLMKFIIITLTVVTLVAVFMAFSNQVGEISFTQQFSIGGAHLAFVIAFMGWMPAPLDLSVWHSLWTLEKQKQSKAEFDIKQSLFDFNIGYIGTTFLALFFMSLGALVMYHSGEQFSPKGTVFAKQLIELYTNTLGQGAGTFIALAAFITMFSTTITCLDALPRSMARAHYLFLGEGASISLDEPDEQGKTSLEMPKSYYWGWLVVLMLGALLILSMLLTNMATFLMIATILSFLTAPFFAIANYILVTKHIEPEHRPPLATRILSILGIAYLFIFCAIYIWSLVG
ncbi:MAG: divalent metal cation transporter [Aureispira sp.]|nr:divalent metal cation transporter [Aureispira sp.]